jgi:hypothetical protein
MGVILEGHDVEASDQRKGEWLVRPTKGKRRAGLWSRRIG